MALICDACDLAVTPHEWVEVRITRPSDPSDMCCIMAGHASCLPQGRTPKEWEAWIENEGAAMGYVFLS